ncbi:MAG TPA: T9SS type A sorting domain-containing protein, partial [Cytophagaceae bacterium]
GAYEMVSTMKNAPYKDMGVIASGTVLLPSSSLNVLHSSTGNVKPTIDVLPNLVAGLDKGAKTVNLTGITDGEAVKSQVLAVSAKSADPGVAMVSVEYTSPNSTGNLVVTPVKVGTTKVRVLVKDNGGVANGGVDSTFTEFTVVVTQVTGVAKADQGTIYVFPNPANGQINVSMSAESITELSIADLSGRVLLQQTLASDDRSTQVDVSQLTKGLYIITAKGKQNVLVTKFYKQ